MNVNKLYVLIFICLFSVFLHTEVYLNDLTNAGTSNYSLIRNSGFGIEPNGLIYDNNNIYFLFQNYLVKSNIDSLDGLNTKLTYMYLDEKPDSFLVKNDILVALYKNDIHIYDVSDIKKAIFCNRIFIQDTVSSMAFENGYLFLSKHTEGLSIFNISDPFSPINTYNYIFHDSCNLSKIVVTDTLAIICNSDSLIQFNIKDMTAPYKSHSIACEQLKNAQSIDFDVHNSTLYASKHGDTYLYLFSMEDTSYPYIMRKHLSHSVENLEIHGDNVILMDEMKQIFSCYYAADTSINLHYEYNTYDRGNYYFAVDELLYRFYKDGNRSRLEKADFTYYQYGVMSYHWYSVYDCSSNFYNFDNSVIITDQNTYDYKYDGIDFEIDTITTENLYVVPYDSFILDINQYYDDSSKITKHYYDGIHWYADNYSALPYKHSIFIGVKNYLISYYHYTSDTDDIFRIYSVNDTLNLIDSIVLDSTLSSYNEMKYCKNDSCLYLYNNYRSTETLKIKLLNDGTIGEIDPTNLSTNSLCFTDNYAFSKKSNNIYDSWIIAYDITSSDSFFPVDSYYTYSESAMLDAVSNKLYLCDDEAIYRINIDNIHEPFFEGYIEWEYGKMGSFLVDSSFVFLSGSNNRKIYKFDGFSNIDISNTDIKEKPNNLFCFANHLDVSLLISQGIYGYVLYDINGRKVLQGYISSYNPAIDLSDIKNGIYFLNIIGEGFTSPIKLTLLK